MAMTSDPFRITERGTSARSLFHTGGKGYDPPAWPPRGLELVYGDSSLEFAPQVTVVLGAALLAYFFDSMLLDLGII